jgi:hypothetical protein
MENAMRNRKSRSARSHSDTQKPSFPTIRRSRRLRSHSVPQRTKRTRNPSRNGCETSECESFAENQDGTIRTYVVHEDAQTPRNHPPSKTLRGGLGHEVSGLLGHTEPRIRTATTEW